MSHVISGQRALGAGLGDEDFTGQVLSFDNDAADCYAEIAAVARSRGASLASRNVKDFVDCGVPLSDPWSA